MLRCGPRWIIGGVSIGIEEAEDLSDSWNGLFPNFQVDAEDVEDEADILIQPLQVPGPNASFVRVRPRSEERVVSDVRWRSRIRLVAQDGHTFPDERHENVPLEYVLRRVTARAMPVVDALTIHASAVMREGRVWVFVGRSGAGKTTIATELSGGGICYAVDLAVVVVDRKGACLVYPTPFSDFSNLVLRNSAAPIAGLVFIRQAPQDCLSRLDVVAALKELMRQVTAMRRHAWSDRRILDLAVELVSTVQCFRLDFRRSEVFWELLDEPERDSAG